MTKYLRLNEINLKDLYEENFRTLLRDILKTTKITGKIYFVLKELRLNFVIFPYYKLKEIPIKIPTGLASGT